jgi:4-hydroxy-2-oxoheptanedioate aldolase
MLRSGQRLRGIFNGIPSPALVEMCAFAGFDFVVIDNEHGSAGLEATEHMLRAARASGLPALVRCLEQDIARTLDLGAGGLQIPMVNTAAHAASLVQRASLRSANSCTTTFAARLSQDKRCATKLRCAQCCEDETPPRSVG